MKIRKCAKCGFILGTRPNLKERDGVCLACVNAEKKRTIDFRSRREWLGEFMAKNRGKARYDCAVAVSGGKDSHMIVKRLYDDYGIKNILLVTMQSEFTLSRAGAYNLKNIAEHFGLDHLIYRGNPGEFIREARKGFEERLNPLRWFESRLYATPAAMARAMGANTIFYGENSAFEYGETEDLAIEHSSSSEELRIFYLGAVYPYSITDSVTVAREAGFKNLGEFTDWQRTGCIEEDTQIESYGYMVDIWCKFPKFGFQRVSDIACRMVRDGLLTREQAERHIRDSDYVLDAKARRDFCRALEITEKYFWEVVDRHVNSDLTVKDENGGYRRRDLL